MVESEFSKEERYLDNAVVSKIRQILANAGVGSEISKLKIDQESATRLITVLINSLMVENRALKKTLKEVKESLDKALQTDIRDCIISQRK
jgi:hypothetical protein